MCCGTRPAPGYPSGHPPLPAPAVPPEWTAAKSCRTRPGAADTAPRCSPSCRQSRLPPSRRRYTAAPHSPAGTRTSAPPWSRGACPRQKRSARPVPAGRLPAAPAPRSHSAAGVRPGAAHWQRLPCGARSQKTAAPPLPLRSQTRSAPVPRRPTGRGGRVYRPLPPAAAQRCRTAPAAAIHRRRRSTAPGTAPRRTRPAPTGAPAPPACPAPCPQPR